MQLFRLLILLLVLFCWACSAETEGGVDVRVTSKESKYIDSIMQVEVPLLRNQMDSICAAEMDAAIDRATDSIVQERLEEEARLRARRPLLRPGQENESSDGI